jgi:hypothetical protein
MYRLANWREGSQSGLFEFLQLALIGVYVLTVIAPHVNGLESSFFNSKALALRIICNSFFVIDACIVLYYGISILPETRGVARSRELMAALGGFLLDVSLVIFSFLRPLRVLRPILVFRRFGVATQHTPGNALTKIGQSRSFYAQASSQLWLKCKFVFLFLYSIALILSSTATLILESELRGSGNIRNYASAVWYSIGEMTLTGSQYNVETLSGRSYSVLLLVMGFGIVGLFTASFSKLIKASLTAAEFDSVEAAG